MNSGTIPQPPPDRVLSLRNRLFLHTLLPFVLIASLGVALLLVYAQDYRRLVASRDFARLTSLFADIDICLHNEVRQSMFELLFIKERHLENRREAMLRSFIGATRMTDQKVAEAQELWRTMQGRNLDAITITRINEGFRKTSALPLWRQAVSSCGERLSDELSQSPFLQERINHHQSQGMTPERARCQALWDLIRDTHYADLSESLGSMILYTARVTPDAAISREITMQSELMRYESLIERENGLLYFLITKGSRPHGLLSDDIGWLRSLWDRQNSAYQNAWSLADENTRKLIDAKLNIEAYPNILGARTWISTNWINGDINHWCDKDLHSIYTAPLEADLTYIRNNACAQTTSTLRNQMITKADDRLLVERRNMILITLAILTGFILISTGFRWLNKSFIDRVLYLSSIIRKVRETGDTSLQIPSKSMDEIGELEHSFNDLLVGLENSRNSLIEARDALENRVNERTAELNTRFAEVQRLNNDLAKAIAELKANKEASERYVEKLGITNQKLLTANQELESFTYTVSHDLRTPLRNITGFIELLQKHTSSSLDKTATHHVEVIIKESRRLGTLIDELLAFSRIGQAEFKDEAINLDETIQDLRIDLSPRTANRRIEWVIPPLPNFHGDPHFIKQALFILLDNALKFTSKRELAKIEIGTLPEKGDNGSSVYFVRDNGAGFNPRYSDKLFRVFQRLHNPRDFDGNGMGLACLRRIIGHHGGHVWAEGMPDKGACFYFSIPAERMMLKS